MIIFIIVPKPAWYKFNNTHTEKIYIYIDDANNVITDSYKKCGVVEKKSGFDKKPNPGLCTSNGEIFKIVLNEYFKIISKALIFVFILLVSDVPLMS